MSPTLVTNKEASPSLGVEKLPDDDVRSTTPSATDADGGSQGPRNAEIERKSAGDLMVPESDDGKEKSNEKGDEHNADDEARDYVTGWKLFVLMAAITIATFLMLLDMSIIVTAIPKITTYFHSLPDVGWYGAAYNLSSASLQPLSGKLYTYLKTKWTFLGFLFLFEVGSLICGVATSSTMFILGRAVAGLGSSGLQNGAFTIIAAAAPLEKRPALMGMVMGCCQMGLIAGPLVGGALTEYTTWRWCFYINFPIGGVAALVILLVNIPDRRVKTDSPIWQVIKEKFDWTGFVLFVPWAVMILLGLEYGGVTYPWKSATVIGLLCGGVVLLVVFIFWEKRVGDGAMIPVKMIRQREIWTANLTASFLFMSIIGASYYLPIYFQSVRAASPFKSGLYILPSILMQLFAAVGGGFLIQRVGYYLPFGIASAVIVTIGNGLFSTFDPYTSMAKWIGYQIFVGFGRGIGMQIAILAIQANAPPQLLAVATALMVFCQTFTGAVFMAVANTVFTNKLKHELTNRIQSVSADRIIGAGATGMHQLLSPELIPAALMSYSKAVQAVFYFVVGTTVCMFFTSFGTGWKDIRKKKPEKKEGEA